MIFGELVNKQIQRSSRNIHPFPTRSASQMVMAFTHTTKIMIRQLTGDIKPKIWIFFFFNLLVQREEQREVGFDSAQMLNACIIIDGTKISVTFRLCFFIS